MKNDSPIAALMLKLKKPQDDGGDEYDAGKEALRVQAKRLIKAIQTGNVDKACNALCEFIDLHEPKTPIADDDSDDE
jgi:hypothetical protein